MISLLGAAFLSAVLRDELRNSRPYVAWALLGIVVVGAALRLLISEPVQMEARPWSNGRVVPLAQVIYDGPVLGWAASRGGTFYLTDVIFTTNLLLAIATPAVLFAYARLLFRDDVRALAAAGLIALLPEHIRFSHSDVAQIESVLTSALTFVALYTFLQHPSRRWRVCSGVAMTILAAATYRVRPENIVFFPLDVFALWVIARAGVPRARVAAAAVLVVALGAFGWVARPLVYSPGERLLAAAWDAVQVLPDPVMNTLLNPSVTPVVMLVVAVVGAAALWKHERARAVFLLGWLAFFFFAESAVIGETLAMQARYHLHLAVPFVLLCAAGIPRVLRLPRAPRAAVVMLVVLSPALHLPFERDVDFYELREFQFLEALRAKIPEGCTVLEFQPELPPGPVPAGEGTLEASRVARVCAHRGPRAPWTVVPLATFDVGAEKERLSDRARVILAHEPRGCEMFFEGLTCRSHRGPTERVAPVCREVGERRHLVLVADASVRGRGIVWWRGVAGRFRDTALGGAATAGILEGSAVPLRLWRDEPSPTVQDP